MFHFAELLRSDFLEVREVETQRVRSYERSFLFYVCAENLTQCFVEQVRTRVVGSTSRTLVGVHTSHHRSIQVFRKLLGDVDRKVVFLLGINDVDGFKFADQHTGVTHLTTAFCIERSVAQNDLIQGLVLLFYLTVAQDAGFIFSIVVTDESGFTFFQGNPVACFYGSGVTCTFFLLLHFCLETFHIGCQAVFTQNQFSQVERESECIIQRKGIYTADFCLAGSLGFVHGLFEQTDTGFQCTEE